MSEKNNPEKEKAELIERIGEGIKAFVQEPPYGDSSVTEREFIFDLGDAYKLKYTYEEGSPAIAKFEIIFQRELVEEAPWITEDQGVTYTITGGKITKEGFYDFRYVNGEHPVNFLVDKERVSEETKSRGLYEGKFFVSPPVSLQELNLLAKVMSDPYSSRENVAQLPSPSSWHRK